MLLPSAVKTAIKRPSPLFPVRKSNPEPCGRQIGLRGRALLAVWSLLLLGGFAVAYRLEPDPRGFGSHEQLGLPPCTIRTLFGVPCPSCGMTTSFANATKGRFPSALKANATAVLLAVASLAGMVWCWLSIYYGRLCGIERPQLAAATFLAVACGLSGLEWVVRLAHFVSP